MVSSQKLFRFFIGYCRRNKLTGLGRCWKREGSAGGFGGRLGGQKAAKSCRSMAAPSLLEEGQGQLRTVARLRIKPSWVWGFLWCQEPAKGQPC